MASQIDIIKAESERRESGGLQVIQITPLSVMVRHAEGRHYTVTGEIVMVTPDLARAWLEKEERNRNSSERRVASYSRDMGAGRWRITNQGIAFDDKGRLIDGGHRLRAVVDSGAIAPFLVLRGLPGETQNKIDMGRVRSVADQYGMWTGADRSKDRVAAARIIRLIVNGWEIETEILTFEEQAEAIDRYKAELDWAMAAFPSRKSLAPAAVAGAWAYAYGATADVAQHVSSFLDGAGLDRGDPLLALRNLLIENGGTKLPDARRTIMIRTLRALWAKLRGERLSKLYDSTEGLVGFAAMRGDQIAETWAEWRVR